MAFTPSFPCQSPLSPSLSSLTGSPFSAIAECSSWSASLMWGGNPTPDFWVPSPPWELRTFKVFDISLALLVESDAISVSRLGCVCALGLTLCLPTHIALAFWETVWFRLQNVIRKSHLCSKRFSRLFLWNGVEIWQRCLNVGLNFEVKRRHLGKVRHTWPQSAAMSVSERTQERKTKYT